MFEFEWYNVCVVRYPPHPGFFQQPCRQRELISSTMWFDEEWSSDSSYWYQQYCLSSLMHMTSGTNHSFFLQNKITSLFICKDKSLATCLHVQCLTYSYLRCWQIPGVVYYKCILPWVYEIRWYLYSRYVSCGPYWIILYLRLPVIHATMLTYTL